MRMLLKKSESLIVRIKSWRIKFQEYCLFSRKSRSPAKADKIRELYKQKLSKSEIARRLGIDRRSVRRAVQAFDSNP